MFEKLIEVLTALIAAINANTAALNGAAPKETKGGKKGEKTETTTTAGATAPVVADVRAAATAYLEAQKDKDAQKAFIDALNAKYGSKRITEAPADKFAEIIAALQAETKKLKEAPAPSADGGI